MSFEGTRDDINLQHFRSRCQRTNPHAVRCGQSQLYVKYDGGDIAAWDSNNKAGNLKAVGVVNNGPMFFKPAGKIPMDQNQMKNMYDGIDNMGWQHVGVSPNYNNTSQNRYKRNLFECVKGDN